jgi:hypothetical protein
MKDMFLIRYVEDCDLTPYPHRAYIRDDGTQTGTMGNDEFALLKSSIAEEGLLHPIIIEWYEGEGDHCHKLQVRVGHNRKEAMRQLGQTRGKVLFVIPRQLTHHIPDTGKNIPIEGTLLSTLRGLWSVGDRARDSWSDSGLLLQLVWETLPDGPNSLNLRN